MKIISFCLCHSVLEELLILILDLVKASKEEWLCGHLVHNILLAWSHVSMQRETVRWELIHILLLKNLVAALS